LDLQTISLLKLVCFGTVGTGTYVTLLGKPKYFTLAVALCSQVHRTLSVHR